MNFLRRNIFSKIILTAIAVITGLNLASCDSFNEQLEPCPQGARLRFVYDYNMEFANAFPSQVDCLTLLVYDKDGNYVTTFTETSSVLSDENWRLVLPLAPGEYIFEAWGGMECGDASFRFNADPSSMNLQGLQTAIAGDCLTAPVGTRLHSLFYGRLTMEIPAESTDYTEGTVEMMKDTNNIRLLLQNLSGEPVDGDDFVFSVTDDNTVLDSDNMPVAGNSHTYSPWASGQVSAGVLDNGDEALLAFAEFSTLRLMQSHDARLVISRRSDMKTIVDIPLINYLLMLKSQEFATMGSQEFLDRESRWNMVFFLDNTGSWIRTYIKINDWVVRINNAEL